MPTASPPTFVTGCRAVLQATASAPMDEQVKCMSQVLHSREAANA